MSEIDKVKLNHACAVLVVLFLVIGLLGGDIVAIVAMIAIVVTTVVDIKFAH